MYIDWLFVGSFVQKFVRSKVYLNPVGHVPHVYEAPLTTQLAPFRHGRNAQKLMDVEQSSPAKPGRQVHLKLLTRSAHVPPLEQGAGAHSLIFVSQLSPEKPTTQAHE